jgi:hypothetical protein
MHKSIQMRLGQEVKSGDISGQVHYDAHPSGLAGKFLFSFSNYCDYYMVLTNASSSTPT